MFLGFDLGSDTVVGAIALRETAYVPRSIYNDVNEITTPWGSYERFAHCSDRL